MNTRTETWSGCKTLAVLPEGKLGGCKFEQRTNGEPVIVATIDDKRYVAAAPFTKFALEANG